MKTINIKAIRIDGGTQPRESINMETVGDYAEGVKGGIEFPPVVVFHDGAEYWLADGFHRYHAHVKADRTSISADVRQGTLDDAKLFASGANGDHGLRRTNADKRLAVLMALSVKADWSDNRIASHVGVSHPFVADVRRSILKPLQDTPVVRTVERAGKAYQQNTTNIGKSKPKKASKPKKSKPDLAVVPEMAPPPEDDYTELDAARDQIKALQDMLAVASMGDVSDEDKAHAKELIAELRSEIKTLRATLKAVTQSRDTLMNDLAQAKRQCLSQRREIDALKRVSA